jgi:hypothetical protein
MSGTEVVRTCGKCGALVLNEEMTESKKFANVVDIHKNPKQKGIFRRADGKLMLRNCGPELRTGALLHSTVWTGGLSALFVCLNVFLGLSSIQVLPPNLWFVVLYVWNLLGASLLVKVAPNSAAGRGILFVFVSPVAVLNIFSFTSLALHIYYDVIFAPRY